MKRRGATWLGAAAGLVAAAGLIGLTGLLAEERQRDRQRYVDGILAQRRAAGTPPYAEPAPPRAGDGSICVRGVETPVVAALRGTGAEVVAGGAVRLETLRQLSSAAVAAERYMEQGQAAPALPQRMGRQRDPDGPTSWRPLRPTAIDCAGPSGADEAYGVFRIAGVSGGAK